jgi:hypothetical protein
MKTPLPKAIYLPKPIVAWSHERGATTLGALMKLAPRLRDLRATALVERSRQRASSRVLEAVGIRWEEVAARVASDEVLAQIEIRASVLGRPSNVAKVAADALTRAPARRREVAAGLLESFCALVNEHRDRPRWALASYLGLDGPAHTLKALAPELGVTRQRIRQLRDIAAARVRAEIGWIDEVRRRVGATLGRGAIPLAKLAHDRWWAAAIAQPKAFLFLGSDVLGGAYQQVEIDGEVFVASFSADAVEAVYRDVRASVGQLALPAPLTEVRALLAPAERLGPRIVELLFARIRASLVVEKRKGGAVAAASGRNGRAMLLALLRTSPTPLRLSSVPPRLRNSGLPPEVIRFGPDLVGVASHFPDMAAWSERLVPAAVRALEDSGPDRHCHAGELREALRERIALPDWLTEWHLAALLRFSGRARSLGRMRFAPLSSPPGTKRVFLFDRITRILREHGEPMPRSSLLEALAQETSVMAATLRGLVAAPPFLNCGDSRVGLLERDLPGGEPARARALDHTARVLARRRGSPLNQAELVSSIKRLSPTHARWRHEMCLSVIRTDARFRIGYRGEVSLAPKEAPSH